MAASLVPPAQLTTSRPRPTGLPELGTIDLVLLTNPRTDETPGGPRLITATVSWASGSRSLTAYREA